MEEILRVEDLHAGVQDKKILNGLNLVINAGETHVIMGPNGAGKSTLANVIFNNPAYYKEGGRVTFMGEDITNMTTDEIARLGLFMSFQQPEEIAGISVFDFIRTAKNKRTGQTEKFLALRQEINNNMSELNMNKELINRELNVGFSGGEKKKNEILQLLEFKPTLAILDETDSGLDVDAIKAVSKGINMYRNENNAALIITHSIKLLRELKVDKVHILSKGQIVLTGDAALADEIDTNGFAGVLGK